MIDFTWHKGHNRHTCYWNNYVMEVEPNGSRWKWSVYYKERRLYNTEIETASSIIQAKARAEGMAYMHNVIAI